MKVRVPPDCSIFRVETYGAHLEFTSDVFGYYPSPKKKYLMWLGFRGLNCDEGSVQFEKRRGS